MIAYENFLGDGHLYSAQLGLVHALGKATLLQADTVFRREILERDAYSWREYIVGGFGDAGVSLGFRIGCGTELPMAEIWRAAPDLRSECAAGSGPWRGGSGYRTGMSICSGSCPRLPSARTPGQQSGSLRLPAYRR